MQAHSWKANCIFQDVETLIAVESSYLFQGFQPCRNVAIIVVAQPVCEVLHFLFFEDVFLNSWYSERLRTYAPFKREYHAG